MSDLIRHRHTLREGVRGAEVDAASFINTWNESWKELYDGLDASESSAWMLHGSIAKAFAKKSSSPKLPDFNARHSCGSSSVTVQGTPGAISGPMRSART